MCQILEAMTLAPIPNPAVICREKGPVGPFAAALCMGETASSALILTHKEDVDWFVKGNREVEIWPGSQQQAMALQGTAAESCLFPMFLPSFHQKITRRTQNLRSAFKIY